MNHQKWIKWAGLSIFMVILGASLITNIILWNKYQRSQDNASSEILTVQVNAFGENNQQLFSYWYQTENKTLGGLMASDEQTYTLVNSGSLGRYLTAITYWNQTTKKWETLAQKDHYYWSIYDNDKVASVGADALILHAYDKIDLKYLQFNF